MQIFIWYYVQIEILDEMRNVKRSISIFNMDALVVWIKTSNSVRN